MNALRETFRDYAIVIAVSSGILGSLALSSCSKSGGTATSSGYSAEYTLSESAYGGFDVTVKGPAAKLGVVLTDPDGKSVSKIISAEAMISNSATIHMVQKSFKAGTWTLNVKTVEPEKVVWQKRFDLSPGQLTGIKVKKFDQQRKNQDIRPEENNWGLYAEFYIENSGEMPCVVEDASFSINGHAVAGSNLNVDGFYGQVIPELTKGAQLGRGKTRMQLIGEYSPSQKKSRFAGKSVLLEGVISYDGGKKFPFKKDLSDTE